MPRLRRLLLRRPRARALAVIGCVTSLAACSDGHDGAPAEAAAGLAPGPGDAADAGGTGSAGNDLAVDAPPTSAEDLAPNLGLAGSGATEPLPSESAEPDAGAPANGPAPQQQPPGPAGPLRLFLAGDSIVQTYPDTPSDRDQAGWGQMLGAYFDARVSIDNRAIGGRTARRFIDEGRLDAIAAELGPGDYLLVQFGTNDGNRTATYALGDQTIPYYLDPETDFPAYLQRYVDTARARGAFPVFVTPTPRNSAYCTGGNGTFAHASAMQRLGRAQAVPVIDLNARAVEFLRAICPAPTPEPFFFIRADGSVDGTHFQEGGARILAGFVADGLSQLGAPFPTLRRPAP